MSEKKGYRVEKDSLGEVKVPIDVYWGKNTQRTLNFFQISGKTFPPCFIHSLAEIKKASAVANFELKLLDEKIKNAIVQACDEILSGKIPLDQFPVDVYQTGSGTAINMNMNEVLANRANEILGIKKGTYSPVHPNDHVNKAQSSNDTIPTTIHLTVLKLVRDCLIPSLTKIIKSLSAKVKEFEGILKVGRTHLQDAVQIPFSLEFQVYEELLKKSLKRIKEGRKELEFIPLGGTAVGTGLNAHPSFAQTVTKILAEFTNLDFKTSKIKAEGIASHNSLVFFMDIIKNLSLSLIKIANDVRLMSSGPKTGFHEISLPSNELGSSIMPGKINPTQAEMLMQVSIDIIGKQNAVTLGEALLSNLELNVSKPLIAINLIESIEMLSNAILSFDKHCLAGIRINKKKVDFYIENNLMNVTKLNQDIGYEKSAEIAKKALDEEKTLKEVIKELFTETEAERLITKLKENLNSSSLD